MSKALFLSPFTRANHLGGGGAYSQAVFELIEQDAAISELRWLAPKHDGRPKRVRQAESMARSLFSSLPSKILYTRAKRFMNRISAILDAEYIDIIVLSGAEMLWVLPVTSGRAAHILVCHNIEHRLFSSYLDRLSVPKIGRALLRYDGKKLYKHELSGLRQIDQVIAISTHDAEYVREVNSGSEVLVLPPVFSYPPYERPSGHADRATLDLGLMAKFDWWPNREGLDWFVDSVLPRLPKRIRLNLFGPGSETVIGNDRRIVRHGYVPELDGIWAVCDVMICPMLSGSGVNVKLVEALYNRMPVLATHFAARGVQLPDDPAIKLVTNTRYVRFMYQTICPDLEALQAMEGLDAPDRAVAGTEIDEVRGGLRPHPSGLLEPSRGGGGSRRFRAHLPALARPL